MVLFSPHIFYVYVTLLSEVFSIRDPVWIPLSVVVLVGLAPSLDSTGNGIPTSSRVVELVACVRETNPVWFLLPFSLNSGALLRRGWGQGERKTPGRASSSRLPWLLLARNPQITS